MTAVSEPDGRALGRLIGSTLLAFMVMVAVLMVALGGVLSPDLVLVFAGLIAIVALSGRPGLRDLLPFPLIALAWEAMRGLSAGATGRVHSTDVVGIERAVSGGVVPTEVLQRAFHTAGSVNPLDIAMTVVYVGHFVVPARPSLHAAFPLLGAIYLAQVRPREGAAIAIYSVVVWFSVVYLGQHYVVDVIGGVVYALAVWVVVRSVAFERFLEWLVGGRVLSPAPVP